MKYVEISMPYFKQGADLDNCLNAVGGDIREGLKMYSEMLKEASDLVIAIVDELDRMDIYDDVQIDADAHMIMMSGPKKAMDSLLKKELVHPFSFEEF